MSIANLHTIFRPCSFDLLLLLIQDSAMVLFLANIGSNEDLGRNVSLIPDREVDRRVHWTNSRHRVIMLLGCWRDGAACESLGRACRQMECA